jgi:hypothetical protein
MLKCSFFGHSVISLKAYYKVTENYEGEVAFIIVMNCWEIITKRNLVATALARTVLAANYIGFVLTAQKMDQFASTTFDACT